MREAFEPARSVEELFGALGANAVLRSSAPDLWAETWDKLAYQPNSYAPGMLSYQQAYFKGAGWDIADASLVLLNDGRPCGLLPLMVRFGETPSLTTSGAPIVSPLFIPGTQAGTIKKAGAWLLERLLSAHQGLGLSTMVTEQTILPSEPQGLSEWQQQQMAAGATVSVLHDVYTDLTLPLETIRSSIRKSFRPLVSSGRKLWLEAIADQSTITDALWDEFRSLHIAVAGRVTRSLESWSEQLAMIKKDEAFFVYLRDPADQRMVGGGLFQVTRDECLYAIGAYDRSLFDKPLGHVVQYAAMEKAIALGLKWTKIGYRPFAADMPAPSAKEIAIGEFKQGFSTHTFPRHVYTHMIKSGGSDV
jgi:FemAB family protein